MKRIGWQQFPILCFQLCYSAFCFQVQLICCWGVNQSICNELAGMKSAHIFSFMFKKSDAYGALIGAVFSLTEQLVDICLPDESYNDFLFRNEDDQTKILTDRFPLIHSIRAMFLSVWDVPEGNMAETIWTPIYSDIKPDANWCLGFILLHVLYPLKFNNESQLTNVCVLSGIWCFRW